MRLLRGYSRVYDDPPEQLGTTLADTRLRMGKLMADTFAELDARLRAGESLPEAWTGSSGGKPGKGTKRGPKATTPDGPARGKEPQ